MGDVEDDIHEADLRNGEPDALSWTEIDEAASAETPGTTGKGGGTPAAGAEAPPSS